MMSKEKDVNYYFNIKYIYTVEEDEEGYNLEIPDLPGCGAYGKTFEEARAKLQKAKKLYIEESLKRGLKLAVPNILEDPYKEETIESIESCLGMNKPDIILHEK